jgi:hypothetical protein
MLTLTTAAVSARIAVRVYGEEGEKLVYLILDESIHAKF